MIELGEIHAATFKADGSFIGGDHAASVYRPEVEFSHDGAVWKVDRVSTFYERTIFYCIRQRTIGAKKRKRKR